MAFLFWCCARTQAEKRQASMKLVTRPAAANEDFGEASCRIEQILLQAEHLPLTKFVSKRLTRYAKHLATPAFEPQRERLERVLSSSKCPPEPYVPGDEITGEQLWTWRAEPVLSAPLLCQLCGSGFIDEASFRSHLQDAHAGEAEYRKRVLYLMRERGPHPLSLDRRRGQWCKTSLTSRSIRKRARAATVSCRGAQDHGERQLASCALG